MQWQCLSVCLFVGLSPVKHTCQALADWPNSAVSCASHERQS